MEQAADQRTAAVVLLQHPGFNRNFVVMVWDERFLGGKNHRGCREMPSNGRLEMPLRIPSTFDSNGTFAIDTNKEVNRLAANVTVRNETLAGPPGGIHLHVDPLTAVGTLDAFETDFEILSAHRV